jgi:hypothetical protein
VQLAINGGASDTPSAQPSGTKREVAINASTLGGGTALKEKFEDDGGLWAEFSALDKLILAAAISRATRLRPT